MKQVGKNTVEFYKPKTYGTTVACKKKKNKYPPNLPSQSTQQLKYVIHNHLHLPPLLISSLTCKKKALLAILRNHKYPHKDAKTYKNTNRTATAEPKPYFQLLVNTGHAYIKYAFSEIIQFPSPSTCIHFSSS